MGKLFTELAIIVVLGIALIYFISLFFPKKKKSSGVSSLGELKDKSSKNKEEREALKGDLSSAETVLDEIRKNTK